MGKANWFFNTRERRWEMRDAAGVMIMTGNNAGISAPRVTVGSLAIDRGLVVQTTGTIQNLNVGTLAILRTLVVNAQGTIQDLRVPSLASLQAVNINAQGSVQNLNVGTLAILQAFNVAGQGSIALLNTGTLSFLSGGRFGRFVDVLSTINTIAAVGTGAMVIATVDGSITAALQDMVFIHPIGSTGYGLGHVAITGGWVGAANMINVGLTNSKSDSAGSFPGIGVRVRSILT